MRKLLSGVVCMLALSTGPAWADDAEPKDIVDTAVGAGSFKTLVAAVQAAELVDALKGEGPLTVFAPTDEAFAKLPKGTVEALLKDKAKLQAILKYHVVAGAITSDQVVKLSSADSLEGSPLKIAVSDAGVTINSSKVLKTDIACSNGVIHVIDTVLLPPAKDIVDTAIAAGSFKTLVAAVKAAELVDALKGEGPLTVFAPTDEAFAKLPKGTVEALLKDKAKLQAILKYHVVAGAMTSDQVVKLSSAKTLQGAPVKIAADDKGVRINDSKVIKVDIRCGNGVIHVIDTVLLPPSANGPKDIVETANAAGSFKTLATALEAAGLSEALQGTGPFTVFAPTDAAFAKLPPGTVEALLKDKAKLQKILKYHVVSGKVTAAQVVKLPSARTLNGQAVHITTCNGVKINNANVTKTDVVASNGVIHVIDTVLLPQ